MWGDHMWGWGGAWSTGGWFWPLHLLWWVLVCIGVMMLFRWGFGGMRDRRSDEDRAVAVLRERFARGEINATEFDERMRLLKA
jgi:putative membrane protein